MVDGVEGRSPIRPIWPWRGRRCEPVRCHDGIHVIYDNDHANTV